MRHETAVSRSGVAGLSPRSHAKLTKAMAATRCARCGRTAVKGREVITLGDEPTVLCGVCGDDAEADRRTSRLKRTLREVRRG